MEKMNAEENKILSGLCRGIRRRGIGRPIKLVDAR